jgi:hypothetical protein
MNTKEFFTRWGQGIKAITPLQMTTINLYASFLLLIGLAIGIYSTYHTLWLFIVLIASFIMALISTLGTYQKYSQLKIMDKIIKESQGGLENESQSTGI